MSRHNLRAPLANNGSVLEQSTPKSWPEWDVPGGQLTTKGGVLEVYMGHYMREWLAQQGLVTRGECPAENSVLRLRQQPATYRGDRAVLYNRRVPRLWGYGPSPAAKMGTMDPTFNPVITDDSAAFSEKAVQAMEKERQTMQLSRQLQATRSDDGLSKFTVLQREAAVLAERRARIPSAQNISRNLAFPGRLKGATRWLMPSRCSITKGIR